MMAKDMKFCLGRLILLTSVFFLSLHAQELEKVDGLASTSPHVRFSGSLASRDCLDLRAWYGTKDDDKTSTIPTRRIFKRAGERWSREDEERLLELRAEDKSWEELTEYFEGRTWSALRVKHGFLKNPRPASRKGKRKKRWTAEEDARLRQLREEEGVAYRSWEEIARGLPGRTASAAFNRYKLITGQLRGPTATSQSFTPEEDDRIIKAVEAGKTVDEMYREQGEGKVRSQGAIRIRIYRLDEAGRLDASSLFRRQYTEADFELMRKKREEGLTWRQIGDEFFPERNPKVLCSQFKKWERKKERKG